MRQEQLYKYSALACAAGLVLAGCTTTPTPSVPPPGDRPIATGASVQPDAMQELWRKKEIRLPDLLVAMEDVNPTIRGARHDVASHNAWTLQARQHPNPDFETEQEEIGSGDSGTTTATISQPIILGSRRREEILASESEASAVEHDLEAVRRRTYDEMRGAYLLFLYNRERELVARDALDSADKLIKATEERLAAGNGSIADVERARIASSDAELQVTISVAEQVNATLQIEKLLAGNNFPTDRLRGELLGEMVDEELDVAPRAVAEADPAVLALRDRAETFVHRAARERALNTPDLRLKAGVSYDSDSEDTSAIVGFKIPIPVFDRREGAIEFQQHEEQHYLALAAEKTDLRYQEIVHALHLVNEYDTLSVIYAERKVPASAAALADARARFEKGECTFTDLLDTHRTHFEARTTHAMHRYQLSMAHAMVRTFFHESPDHLLPDLFAGASNQQ